MSRITQHVIKNLNGGWSVRKGGSSKITRTFENQSAAINYGTKLSRKQGAELYIHRSDGMIREKNSFGIDLNPPKDRT